MRGGGLKGHHRWSQINEVGLAKESGGAKAGRTACTKAQKHKKAWPAIHPAAAQLPGRSSSGRSAMLRSEFYTEDHEEALYGFRQTRCMFRLAFFKSSDLGQC